MQKMLQKKGTMQNKNYMKASDFDSEVQEKLRLENEIKKLES